MANRYCAISKPLSAIRAPYERRRDALLPVVVGLLHGHDMHEWSSLQCSSARLLICGTLLMITKSASKRARFGEHDPKAGQVVAPADMLNASHLPHLLLLHPPKVFCHIYYFYRLYINIFAVHLPNPVQLTENHGPKNRNRFCKFAAAPPPHLPP